MTIPTTTVRFRFMPPGKLCSVLGGNSMLQLVVRSFPERRSSSRSACCFIVLELLCLVSLCGSAAYGQAHTGVAFDESSLNTNLWTVCAPDGYFHNRHHVRSSPTRIDWLRRVTRRGNPRLTQCTRPQNAPRVFSSFLTVPGCLTKKWKRRARAERRN